MDNAAPKLTEKAIIDRLLMHYGSAWKLDPNDPNRNIYLWNKEEKTWMGGERAKNDVLRLLGEIFAGEESHSKFNLDKTMLFLAGQILNDKTPPPKALPPYVIPYKNCLVPVKNWVDETPLHQSTLYPAFEPVEKSPRWFWLNEVPWDYDRGAAWPTWDGWQREVHHAEDLAFVQEWFGYNLYRALPVPAFLINNGPSGAGKSVEIEALEDMVGKENRCSYSPAQLEKDQYARAELHNKLSCISDEMGGGTVYFDGVLKAVTSGETIPARHIYGSPFMLDPYAKMTLSVNDPPDIKTSSEDAIFRRLYFIDWPHTFKQNPDPSKGERQAKPDGYFRPIFQAEMPGILNWTMAGLRRLMDNGWKFTEGRSRAKMFALYRRRANQAKCFMEECIESTGDDGDIIEKEALVKYFRDWQRNRNIKNPISRDKFWRELKEMDYEATQSRDYGRRRVYIGFRLRTVTTSQ